MSLKLSEIQPVPAETARVAQAAFPKGNPYLTLRDELGSIFADSDFAELYAERGQPGLPPWRLALVLILQFREHLSDRQATLMVSSRLDWKYLLSLELTDPGFHFSILSEFRQRLLQGGAEGLLLERLLERCQNLGFVKARGQQRTDATRVLAAIRGLNRLELVGETLRAALNELATIAPAWLREVAPTAWYERYSRRVEDERLPQGEAARATYARMVGEDGFTLLDQLQAPTAPSGLRELAPVQVLMQVWQRHYERQAEQVRLLPPEALSTTTERIESPYDVEARYRRRYETIWTGYQVHLTETCEPEQVHLITHVETTTATVHEAQCTATIQQALVSKGLPPSQHLVDSAYIDAELLVSSHQAQDITLVGPLRPNNSWQTQVEGAYTLDQFAVDWTQQQVRCPQGKLSASWHERSDKTGQAIFVRFRREDCTSCAARALCTQSQGQVRQVRLPTQAQFAARQAAQQYLATAEGRQLYQRRAGIEGTLAQAVRVFGLRQARYLGLAKTHLQHLATAAAINLDRIAHWLADRPRAKTRQSRFAALKA
jgi:transposase